MQQSSEGNTKVSACLCRVVHHSKHQADPTLVFIWNIILECVVILMPHSVAHSNVTVTMKADMIV